MAEYYAQRGSVAGTLLIAEATLIAKKAGGFRNVPGIWSPEQIAGWKQVTDAVHAKGSFIFLQIGALGRTAYVEYLAPEDPYVSSSPKKIDTPMHRGSAPRSADVPRAMTIEEIKEYSQLFAVAASNAIHKAGFDGVEMHAANGHLPEQFLMDSINERTDEYGGSIENRARSTLEFMDAIVAAVGAKKAAIRLSPWNTFQGSGVADPKPTYSYLVKELRDQHPDLGYIHVIEARDNSGRWFGKSRSDSNDFLREIWGDRPYISAGGYSDDRESGFHTAEDKGDLIAYSRAFLANPDLPCRLAQGIPLVEGDGAKYYVYGSSDPSGYTDYPFRFTTLNAVSAGA
ncbi:FMN-linked oxidoreductase [Mycena galericulata]|nr:FMN-linked oxidoreductase [Mycena galericulata]